MTTGSLFFGWHSFLSIPHLFRTSELQRCLINCSSFSYAHTWKAIIGSDTNICQVCKFPLFMNQYISFSVIQLKPEKSSMFSMWLLETIDLGIGKHLDIYLIASVWAPRTHIKQFLLHDPECFHLTRDRQCPNPKYWRCKSHSTFLHKSITSTQNMFTHHTQNSMSNKQLHFCS